MGDSDEKKLEHQLNNVQKSSEVVKKESAFTDQRKQGTWSDATEDYRTSKLDSATMEALPDDKVAEMQANGGWNKFEIVGLDEPHEEKKAPQKVQSILETMIIHLKMLWFVIGVLLSKRDSSEQFKVCSILI